MADLVKHFTRFALLELSALMAVRSRHPGALEAERSHETSCWLSLPPRADGGRRLASGLALRPEEFAGSREIADLFNDVKLSQLQEFCPLEEAQLLEPFKDQTGGWTYKTFGVNPCLLGCVLCLTSGIKEQAALAARPRDIFAAIRAFYAEARLRDKKDRDEVSAPGPRIIWQKVRDM